MAILQNSRDSHPTEGGNTAEGGFFSPVESAYWRSFSRVCVDYKTIKIEISASFPFGR